MLKIYNSVLKESPTDSPFAPKEKRIWPAAIAALGAIGGSVIGSLSNSSSQKSANEANIQMQRETNAMNERIHESDIAQQWRMWNMTNEYNDPSNVVARLKKANVNPALAYGNGMTTPASSVGMPSGSPMQSPHVEPVNSSLSAIGQGLFEGVQQGANAFFQNQLINSQIRSTDTDTGIKQVQLRTEAVRNYIDLQDKMADVQLKLQNVKKGSVEYKKLKAELKYLKLSNKLVSDTYDDLRERESIQNDVMRSQKNYTDEQIALARSQEAANAMGIKLNEAQQRYIFANINDMFQRLKMDKELNQANISEIRNRVIHMINQDAAIFEQIGISKELLTSQKFKNYVGSIVDAIATGASVYLGVRHMMPKRPSPLAPEPYGANLTPWTSY